MPHDRAIHPTEPRELGAPQHQVVKLLLVRGHELLVVCTLDVYHCPWCGEAL